MDEHLYQACEIIDASREDIIDDLVSICKIPALAPENDGKGEYKKVAKIVNIAQDLMGPLSYGTDYQYFMVPDGRVPEKKRANVMFNAHLVGEDKPTMWTILHSDVVPPGDKEAWGEYDPFDPVIEDGKIIGRGVKDNGQQLIAAMHGIAAARTAKMMPGGYNVRMLVVGDEETGNGYGMNKIIDELPFKEGDLFIVPDTGNEDGSQLEVAEKHIRWYKFTVRGKQKHSSLPSKGINATLAAAHLMTTLDNELHDTFNDENELYVPESASTFAITKSEENIENVNMIPGRHVFYMDARVLPEYNMDDVDAEIERIALSVGAKRGVEIELDVTEDMPAAPATPTDAKVVTLMSKAIKEIYPDVEPKPEGIGGGTFCGKLRELGYEVVGWGHGPETDHQPKEFCFVENLVNDAKVYAAAIGILADEG